MPRHPDEPFRKVTLNLYEADCAELEAIYGWGWSEQIRLWTRDKLRERDRHAVSLERFFPKEP